MNFVKKAILKSLTIIFPKRMEALDYKKMFAAKREQEQIYRNMKATDYPHALEMFYKKMTGLNLDLDDPKRYTEKIQWRKINDINKIYTQLTDKYAVREWLEKKIGKEYLIPLLGVWENAKEIDYDSLPKQFVLKTNHGSSTNIIVADKSKLNTKIANIRLNGWLSCNYAYSNGLELHYKDIQPKIIAEKYMQPNEGEDDIRDYKFLCFHGKPYYCWVDLDRYHGHKRKVYDLNWKPEKWTVGPYGFCDIDVPKPHRFDEMIRIVSDLCKGFAHVRVDLYEINGKIYFGEMTFTSTSGIDTLNPDEWDYKLGELWDITVPQIDEGLVDL